ncbi:MAG: sensor histidine kinase, partial [Chloroflexi bacterium]|nr:sensor histidine kinase [Chloroflexota bacterium]
VRVPAAGGREANRGRGAAVAVVAAGVAMAVVYAAVIVAEPPERYLEFLSYYVYQVAPIATLLLSFVPVMRTRGLERAGWVALTGLLATWAAADLTYTYYNVRFDADPPFPGFTDVLYYAGYIGFLAGIGILAFPRSRMRDTRWLIDAAIIMAAAGSISWTFILAPIVGDSGYSARDAAVAMGYPVFDLGLVGLTVVALYAGGGRIPQRTLLLMLSAVVLGVTDSVYTYLVSTVGYDSTANPTDVGYILSYGLMAGCFVLPAEDITEQRVRRQSMAGLVAPYVVGLAIVLTTVTRIATHGAEAVLLFGTAVVVGLVVVRQFMTLAENMRLYRELGHASEARRSLLDMVVRAQEEERHRLTLELHDGPVQALSFLATRIGAARKFAGRGDTARAEKILGEVEATLSHEVQGLRELMMNLRPPSLEERGLVEAVRDLGVGLMRDAGVRVEVRGVITQRPPASTESMLYRVLQEALTNVRKHASAAKVVVGFEEDRGELCAWVQDNGTGFDVRAATEDTEPGHFGLLGIRERIDMLGGASEWESSPENGTLLRVRVPVTAEATREAA